jgi:hypothetical protein
LVGYNGLAEHSIFIGNLVAGSKREINTGYRGLALIIFADGKRYPLIIGDTSFTMKIASSDELPSFTGSTENDFFYNLLAGREAVHKTYSFALIMIQAKKLLESTYSIQTPKELSAKKREIHEFVSKHYDYLTRSDMLRRLLGQYFMMHEYVNYHTEGTPITSIQQRFQQAIFVGVENWLEILKIHIPEHVILNYCVSLYYRRSMVTLASLIIDQNTKFAYCPGIEKKRFSFPGDLTVVDGAGSREWKLNEFKGDKIIAFVSEDCTVSMVTTISKARELSDQKQDATLFVAPLQALSKNHLVMNRMISNESIFFVNDEQWRKKNLPEKMKLPLFVRIGNEP